jgi:hypothetical protein
MDDRWAVARDFDAVRKQASAVERLEARVQELLEANDRYLNRARDAEQANGAIVANLRQALDYLDVYYSLDTQDDVDRAYGLISAAVESGKGCHSEYDRVCKELAAAREALVRVRPWIPVAETAAPELNAVLQEIRWAVNAAIGDDNV